MRGPGVSVMIVTAACAYAEFFQPLVFDRLIFRRWALAFDFFFAVRREDE
jgi:hypothetical protein